MTEENESPIQEIQEPKEGETYRTDQPVIIEEPHHVMIAEPTMIQIIAQLASAPNAAQNVEVMKELLAMQREEKRQQAIEAFNADLSAISSELPRIKRNGEVAYAEDKNNKNSPMKKAFSFARYEDIDEKLRPLLKTFNFSVSFTTEPRQGDGGGLVIYGTLSHKQGHSISASIPLPLDTSGGKNNLQGYGSTISYGKRYLVCMLLNIVTENEDDDGKKSEIDTITVEQAAEIDTRLRALGPDRLQRFLNWAKVETILGLEAKKYGEAMKAIARSEAEAKKGNQNG